MANINDPNPFNNFCESWKDYSLKSERDPEIKQKRKNAAKAFYMLYPSYSDNIKEAGRAIRPKARVRDPGKASEVYDEKMRDANKRIDAIEFKKRLGFNVKRQPHQDRMLREDERKIREQRTAEEEKRKKAANEFTTLDRLKAVLRLRKAREQSPKKSIEIQGSSTKPGLWRPGFVPYTEQEQ